VPEFRRVELGDVVPAGPVCGEPFTGFPAKLGRTSYSQVKLPNLVAIVSLKRRLILGDVLSVLGRCLFTIYGESFTFQTVVVHTISKPDAGRKVRGRRNEYL